MDILDKVLQGGNQSQVALLYASQEITSTQLAELTEQFAAAHFTHRGLVAIECANELTPVIAYLSALRYRMPCMLLAPGSINKNRLVDSYSPSLVVRKVDGDWQISSTEMMAECHEDLAVLLSTSGSTGSAKFVRLSRENLISNAQSIAEYLKLQSNDRGITSLPFHYSYGLSVINSHLVAGGSIVVSDDSVKDEAFWKKINDLSVTNFAGVPYTFEILGRMEFPINKSKSLRFVTQAGGRLSRENVKKFHDFFSGEGKEFYIMYGQTEATARISYVPPSALSGNEECIGIAIPNGNLALLDDGGQEIAVCEKPGELVYTGPNVMMGYAESVHDLSKGKEVHNLRTGDIAARKKNGFFYIVGRMKRFIKIFGVRTNLDDIEVHLGKSGFHAVCAGADEQLVVAVLQKKEDVSKNVSTFLGIPQSAVTVLEYEQFPLLPSGKLDYQKILSDSESVERKKKDKLSFREELANILQVSNVEDGDSFVSLGGDSLSYVEATLALEEHLGFLPEKWQKMSMLELESNALKKKQSGRWLKPFEMSVFLRALAIFTIVSGHFKFLSLPGGASLLFVVAGFNFSRFQMPSIIKKGSANSIFPLIFRIIVPTVAFLGFFSILSGKINVPPLALVSNYWPPDFFDGRAYWFIEVLVQVYLIVFAIFSVNFVRKWADRNQFMFLFVAVLVSYGAANLIQVIWDTDYLYNRVPHMVLGVFLFGALIGVSDSNKEKILTTVLIFVLLHQALLDGNFERADYMFVGAMLLLWVPVIRFPWFMSAIISVIASASMYIYLSHFKARQVLNLIFGDIDPIFTVAFALIAGVAFWKVWENGLRFIQRFHLKTVKHKLKPTI